MTAKILVPDLGESVTEATVSKWFKKEGDAVQQDEQLVELETDKVTLEVNAPASGALISISAKEGDTIDVGALLGMIDPKASGNASAKANDNKAKDKKAKDKKGRNKCGSLRWSRIRPSLANHHLLHPQVAVAPSQPRGSSAGRRCRPRLARRARRRH